MRDILSVWNGWNGWNVWNGWNGWNGFNSSYAGNPVLSGTPSIRFKF